jgi:hypothetical protein
MSALKKALPFMILGGVAAMVGGGVFAYNNAEAKQKQQRDQAFTDLSQCLLGDIVASGDDTLGRMTLVRNRIAHRTEAALADESGKAWPQRCGTITRDMADSVRTSSFLDDSAKRDLLKELEQLQKEVELPNAINTDLGLSILGLWRVAEKHGVRVTAASSVAGPPLLTPVNGIDDLPFSRVEAVFNGPSWAFLGSSKTDPTKSHLCAVVNNGLDCQSFTSDAALVPVGTWSAPNTLPFWDGNQVQILRDGKLEVVGPKFAGVEPKVYVDERGTVYLLGMVFTDEEVKMQLVVKPASGKAKVVSVEKALDRASEGAAADAVTATLLANNVMIRRTGADGVSGTLEMFAISDDAKLAEPVTVPAEGSTDLIPLNCRVGKGFAVDLSVRTSKIVFWQDGKWSAPISPEKVVSACAPSGVWTGDGAVCTASGCVELFSKDQTDAFVGALGRLPSSTRFGDKVVAAWAGREGSGTVVQVGKAGEKLPQTEALIAEKSDANGQRPRVYGDETGATVFAEIAGHLIGARVKADGSVVPLHVSLK